MKLSGFLRGRRLICPKRIGRSSPFGSPYPFVTPKKVSTFLFPGPQETSESKKPRKLGPVDFGSQTVLRVDDPTLCDLVLKGFQTTNLGRVHLRCLRFCRCSYIPFWMVTSSFLLVGVNKKGRHLALAISGTTSVRRSWRWPTPRSWRRA